jgi:hypothetical protein
MKENENKANLINIGYAPLNVAPLESVLAIVEECFDDLKIFYCNVHSTE